MRNPAALLARVDQEMEQTPFDGDGGRLAELLRERGLLIEELCAQASSPEELAEHRVRGEELAGRLRRERARLVEAWGACAHERQLLQLFQPTPNEHSRLAESG